MKLIIDVHCFLLIVAFSQVLNFKKLQFSRKHSRVFMIKEGVMFKIWI